MNKIRNTLSVPRPRTKPLLTDYPFNPLLLVYPIPYIFFTSTMSYVHWQFQTANGDAKVMNHEEFAVADLDKILSIMSVEEKIHMLAVSPMLCSVASAKGGSTLS